MGNPVAEMYLRRAAAREAGLGAAVGLGDASGLVQAAHQALSVAQGKYGKLVVQVPSSLGGGYRSTLSTSYNDSTLLVSNSGGWSPQPPALYAYNQQMNDAMNAFLGAAQFASQAISYIAAQNSNASVYVQGVAEDLQYIQAYMPKVQNVGTSGPFPGNWTNLAENTVGTTHYMTFWPDPNWIEFTVAVAGFAAQAVDFADKALGMPQAATPPGQKPAPGPVHSGVWRPAPAPVSHAGTPGSVQHQGGVRQR